jgi:hypothetical protein
LLLLLLVIAEAGEDGGELGEGVDCVRGEAGREVACHGLYLGKFGVGVVFRVRYQCQVFNSGTGRDVEIGLDLGGAVPAGWSVGTRMPVIARLMVR